MGRRGVNSSFKWFLPVFATRRGRGEGIRALWECVCHQVGCTGDLALSDVNCSCSCLHCKNVWLKYFFCINTLSDFRELNWLTIGIGGKLANTGLERKWCSPLATTIHRKFNLPNFIQLLEKQGKVKKPVLFSTWCTILYSLNCYLYSCKCIRHLFSADGLYIYMWPFFSLDERAFDPCSGANFPHFHIAFGTQTVTGQIK